ncbi:MAG: GumC family protein [Syntrophorhabdales bacterium]|jgi:uncharacterized protein involved in exopolysaccharide biosynthesis
MQARQQQQQQSFNIRSYLTIFFKHKWKILISFVLAAGITCVIALQTPKQFVARGVVMVKFGREFMPVSEVGDVKPPSLNPESIINTEMQLLTGHDLMEKVVDTIGVGVLCPEMEKSSMPPAARREIAILNFRQNVLVNPVKGSNLIEVYFRNDNPGVAAQAVNSLIEMLKVKHLQVFSDPKSSFLEAQLKEYREKLKQSEGNMGSFKQRNQVFSLDEQRSSLLKERDEVGVALKNEQIYVKALQEKIDFLKDRKNVFTDGVVTQLRSNLNGLEQKELELAVKYNDDSEMMADHRKEVQVVREQLRQHEEQVRNAEITKIAADLEPSKVKVAGLQKRYSDVVRDLQQMDARTREFEDLKRDAAVNESNYQIYLKKSEESRISDDLDRRKMTNVTVIERATVPITPVQSKKAKTLGIGAFLSIALSLGLAYAAEYLPHGMTTPQDAARRLGLPILVAIPRRQAARHTPRALRSQC